MAQEFTVDKKLISSLKPPISLLIEGGTKEERKKKIEEVIKNFIKDLDLEKAHPDLIRIENEGSIGIDAVREVGKKLSLKPYLANYKIVLIREANRLTIEAQNAFLKTLEEPSPNSIIILESSDKNLLLETIVSRCLLITQPPKKEILGDEEDSYQKLIKQTLHLNPSERISNLDDKIDSTMHLIMQESFWRQIMLKKLNCTINLSKGKGLESSDVDKISQSLSLKKIIQILKTIKLLKKFKEANVSQKLVLEYLLLSLPKIPL